MNEYQTWWDNEGSAMRPLDNEDYEEFARRMTAIAWSNAEEVEREACAKLCDEFNFGQAPMMIQRALRARGG